MIFFCCKKSSNFPLTPRKGEGLMEEGFIRELELFRKKMEEEISNIDWGGQCKDLV